MNRFAALQQNKTLLHAKLPQHETPVVHNDNESSFTFVVAADAQFGMAKNNADWQDEMQASRRAVQQINALKPLFCCVCGDLVHMTAEIYGNDEKDRQKCDEIQDAQNKDFQDIWSGIDPDIPLVCLCGNHDVGNRPTATSIQRFNHLYGDDYLAFWARQSYNIVVNTSLFNDPSGAPDLFEQQFQWLENRLQYANQHDASHIFVFGHHPWFLYNETEDKLPGASPLQEFGIDGAIDDDYFVIPLAMRNRVLALFQQYKVTAAFAGHFHQNMVSTTSFGMPMITTSALSVILKSTGIPEDFDEPKTRGMRVVTVCRDGSFDHRFVELEESDSE